MSTFTCRHGQRFPCSWCRSQDVPWAGPLDEGPFPRRLLLAIGGRRFAFREGEDRRGNWGLWLWPSAVMLAQVLHDHLQGLPAARVKELRVLEVGAGLALPAMVAAAAGARVAAVDRDPVVCTRQRQTTFWNDVDVTTLEADWGTVHGRFDIVLGADVFYPDAGPDVLGALLDRVWTRVGPALFTDPGRDSSQAGRILPALRGYAGCQELEGTMCGGQMFACHLHLLQGN